MKHENSNYIMDRQSPRPSAFYDVHSPSASSSSGSSEDNEEKTNDLNSPQNSLGSPHSDHSGRRDSSFSLFVELWNNRLQGHSRRPSKYESHDNEEKGFLKGHDDHDSHHHEYSRCRNFFAFVVGFVFLFSIFSLILWIVSCHQKPTIILESITFDKFYIQANGVDARGFLTSTLSMNSSLKLNFRNTRTFFRVHVTSIPLNLNYYQLPLATGNIPMFDQSKKSERSIEVIVNGNQIPLYGVGANLKTSNKRIGLPDEPVPLKLSMVVSSKAYVVGRLVTTKFYKKMECAFVVESNKIGMPIPLANKCK